MKAAEKERLTISLFAAVVMHIFIVLFLGLVDLYEDASTKQTLGPVMVRLQEVRPRVLPEEAPPEESVPAAQSEAPAESAPDSAEPAASEQASSDRLGSTPAPSNRASSEGTTPAFEWEAPKGEYRGLEGSSSDGARLPSSRDPEERAVSRADTAPEYGEPKPETERRWSESEVFVEEQRGEDESARGEAESLTGAASSAPQSVLSKELKEEIEGISAAGTGRGTSPTSTGPAGTGQTAGGRTGDATGSGSAASDESTGTAGKVPFSIEGIRNRDLLYYELPALTDEEKSKLPRSLEVAVSFILTPSGIPTDVHLTRGASTGHPEIDNKIVEAVRSWKFSALSADSTGDVTGIIRIELRAR